MSHAGHFISLCSGAGGLDDGLEKAGWRNLTQIELDGDCCETLRMKASTKRVSARIIEARLENVNPRDVRLSLGLKRGDLGLIAGGPPCQPFTTHGLRQSLQDRRASSVFPHYLSFVREFLPQYLVIENVDGMLSAALQHVQLAERGLSELTRPQKKGSFLQWLLFELSKIGYSLSWGIVEAADYGVAQYRQRAFVLGSLNIGPCFLPGPTVRIAKTVRDAIYKIANPGPIQPLSKRKIDVYSLIPSGGNWRSLPVEKQKQTMGAAFYAAGGKSGWWRRLDWDSPAPTILGMPDHSSTGLVHPTEVRCLGLNECAALQSFRQKSAFFGSPRSQYQQVGNAVPPLLAAAVGKALAEHRDGKVSELPRAPEWRSASANRRIGTHGWLQHIGNELVVTLNSKVRPDHIWACESDEFRINRRSESLGSFDKERLRSAA